MMGPSWGKTTMRRLGPNWRHLRMKKGGCPKQKERNYPDHPALYSNEEGALRLYRFTQAGLASHQTPRLSPNQNRHLLDVLDVKSHCKKKKKTETQLFSGSLFPFSFCGCPTKMVFPKRVPFFSMVTEQLRRRSKKLDRPNRQTDRPTNQLASQPASQPASQGQPTLEFV